MTRYAHSASAPAKVILFGEHFVVYGSPAILAAINRRTVVYAKERKDGTMKVTSDIGVAAQYGEFGSRSIRGGRRAITVLDPIHKAARKVLERAGHNRGVDIMLKSQIPYGIGLGSSAAACVATIGAVDSITGGHERRWICDRAIEAERVIHGNSSGADCYVSTFGGIMRYSRQEGYRVIRAKDPLNMVVSNTGIRHSTGDLVEKVRRYREANPSLFRSIESDANEICVSAVAALESGDYARVGRLLTENQALLEKIGVSHRKAGKIISLMMHFDALGAKITGAGGGGAVIGLASTRVESAKIARKLNREGFQSREVEVDLAGLIVERR